jgi:hypothetical protein
MAVHVERMTSEVGVFDGELPLSEAQIEKLLKRLQQCLERKERDSQLAREATTLRPSAAPTGAKG